MKNVTDTLLAPWFLFRVHLRLLFLHVGFPLLLL